MAEKLPEALCRVLIKVFGRIGFACPIGCILAAQIALMQRELVENTKLAGSGPSF